MNIEFYYTDILNILNNFSNCTNLIASFHFENQNAQDQLILQRKELEISEPNSHDRLHTNFCSYIHTTLGATECFKDDDFYKKKAREERKTIIYGCFAGLCETITPIILDNIIVGYVMLGKFIDAEHKYSNVEKVVEFAKKNNLDVEKVCALYDKVPVISSIQLKASLSLLNISIAHILNTKIINLKEITILEQIKTYIDKNHSSHLTIDDICREFFINRQKLYAIFKEDMGISVKQYITNLRIDAAKKMLRTTEKSISQIAIDCGFPEYNYFIRRFKECMGMTPLHYRKNFTSLPPQ